MNRLLISIDRVEQFSLHVNEALDIIDVFLPWGWQVDIVTSTYGKTLSFELEKYKSNPAFRIISDKQGTLADAYSLVWVYKGFIAQKLLPVLETLTGTAPVIFRHFYDYHDIYMPWGAELENQLASLSLSLSPVVSERLLQNGLLSSQIAVLPFTVPSAFSCYPSRNARTALKRILYYAPDISAEMYELQQQLKSQSITLEWFDCSQPVSRIEPEWLDNYDMVMGGDEIVAKALILGIPVFLASTTGVEGYLNAHNLQEFEQSHFTVVNLQFCPETEEWIAALKRGFSEAVAWTRANQGRFGDKWTMPAAIQTILSQLPAPKRWSMDDLAQHALRFHRQSVLSWADKNYSIEQWLKDRSITEARRAALQSFIQSVPESGDIGIVIIDENGDAAACERSLAAVRQQTLPPATVMLLSDVDIALNEGTISACASGWVAELNEVVYHQTGPAALLLVMAGDELLPDALLLLAEQRLRRPETAVWYVDETFNDDMNEPGAILRPDPNIDLLRSTPYVGRTLLFDRRKVQAAGKGEDAVNPLIMYEWLWRCIENQGPGALGHVADVVVRGQKENGRWNEAQSCEAGYRRVVEAHLQRLGIKASLDAGVNPGFARVRYQWDTQPLISIIVPTRDHATLLRACIDTLMEKTRYPYYELLIVDNQSVDAQACTFLNDLDKLNIEQIKVLRYDAPFNFAAMHNRAAEQAKGDVLLFLDNDCQITQPDWLDALLEHALRPEVALVGARLEYHDGRVQHGGYLLGVQNGVDSPWEGMQEHARGFQSYLQTEHNLAAVSASCMMVRKDVFFSLGGFAENDFPLYFADVDLGLRAQQQGYLNVWTPWSRVRHMGGATRLMPEKFNVQERPFQHDYSRLRQQWRATLLKDPSNHPLMQRAGKPFTLGAGTARFQQPLPGRPLPVVLAHHVDWQGCGNHRILQPFKAMESQLLLEGGLTQQIPGVMEVALLQPDIIVLESLSGGRFPSVMAQYRDVCDAKIVVEYDDYLLNVPVKNGNRNQFPKQIVKNLRKVMECADWVVVSTAPLADAYSRFHHDIRIAQNRLAEGQWGHLTSQRGVGRKVRIGWAGGSTHAGDLQILLPLIKELEDKVEWVFMGMKPRGVHCEFHTGVPFDMYPEKLASLNLDLALVPLEVNQFNECKSNLRLLEIGTCGVPIIATSIEPYRCGLPVTLVENRFKDWMGAIRAHLADMDATRRLGDQLRAAVHQDWYLREQGLNEWQRSWLSA
ncbi:glycosyltransferase [Pantoea stewartii]|uniref:glycosyltransferase n=1 Tax=Pantoea stewartii TaxID=66269 RepID=UPI001625C114|nr:glycosyltransferase [Pantoea stewartii]MBC0853089.1 glycosyltransferase [Pantoea stewartii]